MAVLAELLVKLGVRVDGSLKAEDRLKRLKQRAGEFGSAADGASRKTGRLGRAFRSAGDSANKLFTSLGGLKGVGLLAAGALGTAAVSAFKMVDGATAALDKTNKLSAALGINAEELQRLQFAAGQSGLSQANLEKGIRNLNKAMTELRQGGGGVAKKALDDLGLSLDDLNGRTQAEQIGIIGDALNRVGSDAERSALAAQLFGQRAGPEMATLLASGTSGLQELMAQASNVFSKDDLSRASDFQDQMGRLRDQASKLGTSIGVELLPPILDTVKAMADWIEENREFINQAIAAVFRDIADAAGAVRAELSVLQNLMRALNVDMGEFGTGAEMAGVALDYMRGALQRVLSPMRTVGNDLIRLTNWMRELGVVSGDTAQSLAVAFGAASGKNEEEIRKALDLVKQLTPKPSSSGGGGIFDSGWSGRDVAGSKLDRMAGIAAGLKDPAAGRSGGGGRGKKTTPKKKKTTKPVPKGILVDEAIGRLLGGDASTLYENMALMSPRGSSDHLNPTVVMHITNNDHRTFHNDVDINVSGAGDPNKVGANVEQRIEPMLARIARGEIDSTFRATARSIPNAVKR